MIPKDHRRSGITSCRRYRPGCSSVKPESPLSRKHQEVIHPVFHKIIAADYNLAADPMVLAVSVAVNDAYAGRRLRSSATGFSTS